MVNGSAKSLTLQHITPLLYVTHRRDKEVWAAFWTCQFPPRLFDSVYTTPWSKFKVQQRIRSFFGTDQCPLCPSKLETITHALRYCKFFPHVYFLMCKAFGLDTATWRLGKLEAQKSVDSVFYWTARRAHLGVQCKAHLFHIPTLSTFRCVGINNIQCVIQWRPLEHLIAALLQLRHFVQEHNETEVLPAPELLWRANYTPISPPQKKKQAEHAELATHVVSKIQTLGTKGWTTGNTDGSAKIHPCVGMVGGYGAYVPHINLELSRFLPTDEPQTNNRGKLMAAIELLRCLPRPIMKPVIATDLD